MGFSLTQIFAIGIGYLSFFFLVAYLTERGYIPVRFVRHPVTYSLSLGIFASAWSIYGSIGFAHDFGYNFLAYYLGMTGAFMLAPIILAPILRLTQTYQLGSLADLLSFRYRSPIVGTVVTIFMLIGILPLLALQIQAVADSVHVLNPSTKPAIPAFLFVLIIILFAILFGARHITSREKHEGLVVAIAFESLIKVIAFLTIGGVLLFEVFGGPLGLNNWLDYHPEQLVSLYQPLEEGPWRSLVAAFFVASVVMPHVFHMAFTENLNPRALLTASWGLPMYLFLMALPVLIVMWSAAELRISGNPEHFILRVPQFMNSGWLTMLAFTAGLSAASGVIIVCTLSLSAMILNHIILPLAPFYRTTHLYTWLLWSRRILIAAIILVSYGFYVIMEHRHTLSELAFLSFSATMQFLPALVGVLLWPTANRDGFLAGLAAGVSVWLFGLLIPELLGIDSQLTTLLISDLIPPLSDNYTIATFAVALNFVVFGLVSLLTEASPEEIQAAETCNVDNLRRPQRWALSVTSPREVIERLTKPLGKRTALREVELALNDLAMSLDETRPYALRRLRDQLESNLSGLLGPAVANDILASAIPYVIQNTSDGSQDIHFIESRLEEYRDKLTGLAGELDSLRRYHRQTLQDLPVGVCSLGNDGEVLGWNSALEEITGVSATEILGSQIGHLKPPWNQVFSEFMSDPVRTTQMEVSLTGAKRWISLHKAVINLGNVSEAQGGQVVVVEDTTEVKVLEHQVAHNERLASVGRLAAGVAHEIGNPITGIACLAQNLKFDSKEPEVLETSDQIMDQTKRITRIVQSLVSFSHSGSTTLDMEPVPVRDCVQEAMDLLSLNRTSAIITFRNKAAPEHAVKGDQQRLTQVFINLLSNACDALDSNGFVEVNSKIDEYSVEITVEDNGSGIPPDVLERIYEPFVTTKDPGKGTGLGMSLVYSIIEEHAGSIEVVSPISSDFGGTRVTIVLPRAKSLQGETSASEVTREEHHEPHSDR